MRAGAPDPTASAPQRAVAVAAHLSMWLVAFVAANGHLVYMLYALLCLWVPPGRLWLATRRRRSFAAAHCAQALALGASLSLLCALLAPALLVVVAGLLALPLLMLVMLASMGLAWPPPLRPCAAAATAIPCCPGVATEQAPPRRGGRIT